VEGPRTAAAADGAPDATPPDDAFALGCPHFEQCPGCTMAEHLDEPPTLARARAFFEARGVPSFAARTGATRGWRTRAKLAVRSVHSANGAHGKADPLALGLFARGTHDLVEIPECVVHHPRINQAARYVADVANAAGVRAYDEKTGDGHLRYAQFTAVASKERGAAHLDEDATVQVALVWNGRPPVEGASMPAALRKFIDALVDGDETFEKLGGGEVTKKGKLLHGVWVNFNDSSTNEIVNADQERWHHAHGSKYVWCTHGDARVCYAPGSFLQANTEAYNALLLSMRQNVPNGSAVSELHAGAGAIGLSLAASEKLNGNEDETENGMFSLRCVEIVEAARETFEVSARETFGESSYGTLSRLGKVSFLVAAAADVAAEAVIDADVVVVDPPRKGLDARTLAALAGHDGAHDGDGDSDDPNEVPNKPPDLSTDPRRGKQGAAGSGRKKRNKRNRRAKKRLLASEDVSFAHFAFVQKTPPPPDRLRTLIYVSCGFASFERDCDALIASKQWALRRAEGFNFFPGSDALETLAVFERVER
jgi:tRNA/tmRNA/rRNA uracil-C5-methylase (TrmA/RlmC/RlmD family)